MTIEKYQTSAGVVYDMAMFTPKGQKKIMEALEEEEKEEKARLNRDTSKFKSTIIHTRVMKFIYDKAKKRANVVVDITPVKIAKALKLPLPQVEKAIDDLYYYGLIGKR